MKNKINELVKNFMEKQYGKNPKKYYAMAGIFALNILLFPYVTNIYSRYYSNKTEITHIVTNC
jgi:uncharacterized membrane protein (DUF106 family)